MFLSAELESMEWASVVFRRCPSSSVMNLFLRATSQLMPNLGKVRYPRYFQNTLGFEILVRFKILLNTGPREGGGR